MTHFLFIFYLNNKTYHYTHAQAQAHNIYYTSFFFFFFLILKQSTLILCAVFCFFSFSLSGNKGLCGVPSLPTCPIFWENGRLSKNGKIAIGVSSTFLFCALLAVIYICCIRRRRNDYDFGLPSELICKYHVQTPLIFSLLFCLPPPSTNLRFCMKQAILI